MKIFRNDSLWKTNLNIASAFPKPALGFWFFCHMNVLSLIKRICETFQVIDLTCVSTTADKSLIFRMCNISYVHLGQTGPHEKMIIIIIINITM